MFENTKAFSGFAVDDIEAAKQFYGETLGLKVSEANGMLTLHIAGDRADARLPAARPQPAAYTILNFPVDDIDAAVDALAERGVEFERYDGMEQDDKGVIRGRRPVHRLVHRPGGQRPLGAPGAVTTRRRHRRRRARVRRAAAALLRGARARPREVPRRADRLRRLLARRDADGLRVLQGGARGPGGVRAREVPDAHRRRPALQLGHRPAGRHRHPGDARARLRRVAVVVPKKLAAAYDERFFAGEI